MSSGTGPSGTRPTAASFATAGVPLVVASAAHFVMCAMHSPWMGASWYSPVLALLFVVLPSLLGGPGWGPPGLLLKNLALSAALLAGMVFSTWALDVPSARAVSGAVRDALVGSPGVVSLVDHAYPWEYMPSLCVDDTASVHELWPAAIGAVGAQGAAPSPTVGALKLAASRVPRGPPTESKKCSGSVSPNPVSTFSIVAALAVDRYFAPASWLYETLLKPAVVVEKARGWLWGLSEGAKALAPCFTSLGVAGLWGFVACIPPALDSIRGAVEADPGQALKTVQPEEMSHLRAAWRWAVSHPLEVATVAAISVVVANFAAVLAAASGLQVIAAWVAHLWIADADQSPLVVGLVVFLCCLVSTGAVMAWALSFFPERKNACAPLLVVFVVQAIRVSPLVRMDVAPPALAIAWVAGWVDVVAAAPTAAEVGNAWASVRSSCRSIAGTLYRVLVHYGGQNRLALSHAWDAAFPRGMPVAAILDPKVANPPAAPAAVTPRAVRKAGVAVPVLPGLPPPGVGLQGGAGQSVRGVLVGNDLGRGDHRNDRGRGDHRGDDHGGDDHRNDRGRGDHRGDNHVGDDHRGDDHRGDDHRGDYHRNDRGRGDHRGDNHRGDYHRGDRGAKRRRDGDGRSEREGSPGHARGDRRPRR